jgi:hypothetical protein
MDFYGEIEYLGSETVDGASCYVIQLTPDIAAMMDWMAGQGMADMGLEELVYLDLVEDMFEDLAYTVWVDKDTKYIKKMEMHMLAEMSAEDLGEMAAGEDFTMTMEISMVMEMYDLNQPVEITLPAEAEDAIYMDY